MSPEPVPDTNRWVPLASAAILVIATGLLLRSIWISLAWPMELDTPLLHYMGFAVDYGVVPYRDLFVTSFPGAILLHLGILRTVGSGDQAFMLVNLVWLAAVIFATWRGLAPLGRRVALAGGVLFGLVYLHGGANIAMQRDAVLILPIACAASLSLADQRRTAWRALVIGLCFGLAATIKPHSAMGLPFVLWLGAYSGAGWLAFFRRTALAAVGFLLPLLCTLAWLVSTGGWEAFLEMVTEYLPLHLELSGHHEELKGGARWLHILKRTLAFGPEAAWLIAAVPGWLMVLKVKSLDERARRALRLFGVLAVVYALYPAVAGQFWNYHWVAFEYFAAQLAAFCLLDPPELRAKSALRFAPLVLLVAAIFVSDAANLPSVPDEPTAAQLAGQKRMSKRTGYHHRVHEISDFLKSELEPGDRVQPLDWVAGGIHAMLVAEAHIASPFPSDYHFYHHVDHPFVQGLRKRLIDELSATPPRFIVELHDIPRPKGEGSGQFLELQRLIRRNYVAAKRGQNWTVWELRSIAND